MCLALLPQVLAAFVPPTLRCRAPATPARPVPRAAISARGDVGRWHFLTRPADQPSPSGACRRSPWVLDGGHAASGRVWWASSPSPTRHGASTAEMRRNAPSEGPRVRRLERPKPQNSKIGRNGARRLEPGDKGVASAAVKGQRRDLEYCLKAQNRRGPAKRPNSDLMVGACAACGALAKIGRNGALRLELGDGSCFWT